METTPTLIVMVGISGSGKSTFANGLKTSRNATVVETDAIRLELTGDPSDQTQNRRVFEVAMNRVRDLLKQGKTTVIDATSLSVKDRRVWIDIAKECGAKAEAYVVKVDPAVAKKQNAQRIRQVPEWVIDRQLQKFTIPTRGEGFDKVTVV